MTEKFCRDCVHLRQSGVMRECASPQLGKNLVTGEDDRWPADVLRKSYLIRNWNGEKQCCGPDGSWFEARPQTATVEGKIWDVLSSESTTFKL